MEQRNKGAKTTDDSPQAVEQLDDHNCGIFAVQAAFNLAFGYELQCFQEGPKVFDPRDGKKPRMAIELRNGGFTGDYQYVSLVFLCFPSISSRGNPKMILSP